MSYVPPTRNENSDLIIYSHEKKTESKTKQKKSVIFCLQCHVCEMHNTKIGYFNLSFTVSFMEKTKEKKQRDNTQRSKCENISNQNFICGKKKKINKF